MGKVVSLQLVVKHGKPLRRVDSVEAIVGHGLEGDVHTKRVRGTKRQVLLLDTRVVESVGLQPGDLREQVTVDFPELMQLPEGTSVAIGEAVMELTMPCPVCDHVAELTDHPDKAGLTEALEGGSGMLAKVVATSGEGRIQVGDSVRVYERNTSK